MKTRCPRKNTTPSRRMTPVQLRNLARERDVLLENDAVFADNMRSLILRLRQGKVCQKQGSHVRQWLTNDCLRRNGVSLWLANQMLRAG
jgi:hypothetical protein